MPRVTEPFPIFYDDDGTPLQNGMIYIGEFGLPAVANPIQAYWDEDLTVTATQPIRTLNGRPAYQGAPANIYIAESTFSIAVQNRYGTPVVADDEVIAEMQIADMGAFNVKDFGAAGDNSNDDTAAIDAAIAAAKVKGGVVFFPPGIYRHTGISSTDLRFVSIEGVARASFGSAGNVGVRLVCTSATANHVNLTNPHGVQIKNIQFETLSSLTPTAGAVIQMTATNGGSASCSVVDCRIEKHYNGIVIDGVSNSELRNIQVRNGVGTFAVKLVGSNKRLDQVRLKGIITDTEVTGGSATQNGFEILTDVHTVFIEDCSALQARVGYVLDGAIPPEFVYLVRAEAENCNDEGFLIEAADKLRMLEVYSSVNNGSGIVFGSGFDNTAYLLAPDARGNEFHGILIQGTGAVEIVAPRIGGNSEASSGTYHGITIAADVNNFSVIGGKVGGDINLSGTGGQGRGISIANGTSDDYRIIGVDLQGNVSAGLVDGGSGTTKAIESNLGFNNASAVAQTVGASPWTYTNVSGAKVSLTITGGTVSSVTVSGDQVAAATNTQVIVPVGGSAVITYSGLPVVKAQIL